jgi:hypothetical protein
LRANSLAWLETSRASIGNTFASTALDMMRTPAVNPLRFYIFGRYGAMSNSSVATLLLSSLNPSR